MRISARNALKGKVTKLIKGPVSTEVTVRVAKGVEIVSSVTTISVKNLGLKIGKSVYVVIKASSVMIAID